MGGILSYAVGDVDYDVVSATICLELDRAIAEYSVQFKDGDF